MTFIPCSNPIAKAEPSAFLLGKTIADLLLLLKYAAGKLPLQDIRQEFKGEDDLINLV